MAYNSPDPIGYHDDFDSEPTATELKTRIDLLESRLSDLENRTLTWGSLLSGLIGIGIFLYFFM